MNMTFGEFWAYQAAMFNTGIFAVSFNTFANAFVQLRIWPSFTSYQIKLIAFTLPSSVIGYCSMPYVLEKTGKGIV